MQRQEIERYADRNNAKGLQIITLDGRKIKCDQILKEKINSVIIPNLWVLHNDGTMDYILDGNDILSIENG